MSCKRCGKCCTHAGINSTWWKDARREPFTNPVLVWLVPNYPSKDDEKGCKMFTEIDGQNVCAIEFYFGKDQKPEVCNEFTEENCKEIQLTLQTAHITPPDK